MGSAANKVGDAMGGGFGKALSVFSPGTWALGGISRTIAGIQTMARAPRDAADAMARAQDAQTAEQAKLLKQMQLQPQVVQGDNFVAQKEAELSRLRRGVAATLKTGTAGGGMTSVYSPSLKAKTGQ